jgi:hypothetical protein
MQPDIIIANLTSPAVLAFAIGAFAAFIKSDLRVPPQVFETISMYLLLAIGLKGGLGLYTTEFGSVIKPVLGTILIGVITPLFTYFVAKKIFQFSTINSSALAAHFGSVSAVTFMAALNFAAITNIEYEGYMTALLVVLEVPGIIIALVLAAKLSTNNSGKKVNLKHAVLESITSKSIILLAGGLFIGMCADRSGIEKITGVFVSPFQGILVFFMLELGFVAASRYREVQKDLKKLLVLGTVLPLIFGTLGTLIGISVGLSAGGTAILATMAASASYIAAPAAVKIAIPEANPAIYLTTAISITLPFNIAFGIPLYFEMAKYFTS